MHRILNRQINMMDENGIIIASTDAQRIGQYHEGAHTIVRKKLDEMVVGDRESYEGTREGVNLPIWLHNHIEGVVGITGKSSEVAQYGRIIQKMTEILLLDAYNREQEMTHEKMKTRFIRQWLFDTAAGMTPDFAIRGQAFGIDVRQHYRALTAVIPQDGEGQSEIHSQMTLEHVGNRMKNWVDAGKGNVFFRSDAYLTGFFRLCGDDRMLELARELKSRLEAAGVSVAIGIDSLGDGPYSILAAYRQAKKAAKCAAGSCKNIRFYRELNVGIFMDEIPAPVKREFIRRVFSGCPKEQIEKWIPLLEVFFQMNGSINRAAEKLYIHKNTLQYQLNKLFRITGHNPRNLADAALFYLAIQFHRSMKFKNPDA